MIRHLIVEPDVQGHHYVYLRLLIEAAERLGDEVILALNPNGPSSPEFAANLNGLEGAFDVMHTGPVTIRSICRHLREVCPDHLIVPNGDRLLMQLGLLPSSPIATPLTTILMQDVSSVTRAEARNWLKYSVKTCLVERAATHEGVFMYRLKGPGQRPTVDGELVVNDPVVIDQGPKPSTIDNELEEMSEGRYWFAMVGVIAPWKNPGLLTEALQELAPPDCGLVLAGPTLAAMEPDLTNQIRRLRHLMPVIRVDRMLTNAEMNHVVAKADCVVLPYSTHAPTSTLGKAAVLGTRIVAAGSTQFVRNAEALGVNALTSSLSMSGLVANLAAASRLARPPVLNLNEELFADELLRGWTRRQRGFRPEN